VEGNWSGPLQSKEDILKEQAQDQRELTQKENKLTKEKLTKEGRKESQRCHEGEGDCSAHLGRGGVRHRMTVNSWRAGYPFNHTFSAFEDQKIQRGA